MTSNSAIQNSAVLTRLSMTRFNDEKQLPSIPSGVLRDHYKLEQGSKINQTFHLFGENQMYDDIYSAMNSLRSAHYKLTLKYDVSVHLLPSTLINEYIEVMEKGEEKVKLTLEGFRSVYDEVVSDSQIKLGELLPYVKHLYVPKDECMRQFSLSYKIDPIPDHNHFDRILGHKELADKLIKKTEDRMNERINVAVKELFIRLKKPVVRMSERLANEESKFRDTLVSNIREIIDLFPKLNLTGDEGLSHIAETMKRDLYDVSPDRLREDINLREDTKAKVDNIIGLMDAYG
jgi:hypothetical protein